MVEHDVEGLEGEVGVEALGDRGAEEGEARRLERLHYLLLRRARCV